MLRYQNTRSVPGSGTFALFERLPPLMTIISISYPRGWATPSGAYCRASGRAVAVRLCRVAERTSPGDLIQELDELDSTMGAAEETSEEMLSEA